VGSKRAAGPKRSNAQGARRVDQLGRQIDAEAIATQPTCRSVFDGQLCIGHLVSRKLGVEANDPHDKSLGVFSDLESAADAVSLEKRRAAL
jgi:hypothetical protein